MNDRERQTEFLRQCLLYDESSERHKLAEGIRRVQQNERCVRRAMWLMVLVAALAFAGLAYSAVFLVDFPQSLPDFVTRFITKLFCVLGLSSLICIPAFVGLELVYRKELNERREECRRLASELLESRLGKPRALEGSMPETFTQKVQRVNHSENNVTVTGSANSQPADHHQERRN
jgi:hypothetical protein